MNRTVRKILNTFSTVCVALAVMLAVLLVGARIVGLRVFTVLSGSMEPTYHTGALIYVKKVDPVEIKAGQVITFMLDENTVATHRVVGVVPDEDDPATLRFRTKGDANDAEDGSLVHYKNVIGTPVFTIPYLGYVADYIQHPPACTLRFPQAPYCSCSSSCPTSSPMTARPKANRHRQTPPPVQTANRLNRTANPANPQKTNRNNPARPIPFHRGFASESPPAHEDSPYN